MLTRLMGQGREAGRARAPGVDPGERVYAVGDVHGRADLLAPLIGRIGADAESRADGRALRLIFLGDYIDRGDGSRETLDLLLRVRQATPADGVVFLRGNHEAALLDFVADPAAGAAWLEIGGRQTLASYGVAVPGPGASTDRLATARDALVAAMGAHLDLVRRTRLMARSGAAVFAHAGFDPGVPDAEQSEGVLLWGEAPPGAAASGASALLVHGHFATDAPVESPTRINVDTGAFHSGRLTAVRLDAARGFLSAP